MPSELSVDTTRQALEAKGRSAPLKVTGKLKLAIQAMVWSSLKRPEAAQSAGMTDHGLREALRRPHVKAYLLHEMEVLRTSERPRNIQRLAEIRDAADNMPAVQAIRMLEQLSEETPARSGASVQLPGIVIQIVQAAPLSTHQRLSPSEGQRPTPQVIDNEG